MTLAAPKEIGTLCHSVEVQFSFCQISVFRVNGFVVQLQPAIAMIILGFFVFWGVVIYHIYFYAAYRPRKVSGDVVLITGGGSGIGRLMAHRFAEKGASVVLWDVNREGLEKVKGEITAKGAACATYVVDVTDREKVYATAKAVGRVDILVNNAGIVTGKSILECDDRLMEKTMQVNTISHFWTIKAFLPGMLERNYGNIVTIASAAGLNGVAGLVDYCASKYGAVGTGEALYMELQKRRSKVRCLTVCPFYINTGMFDGAKTKYPWLLPILDENYAANRIVLAVVRGEEFLAMPYLVHLARMLKVLPITWQLFTAKALGVTESMDDFKGRAAIKK
jgi:all-trans-retinol dehydrogenase (NAD+)